MRSFRFPLALCLASALAVSACGKAEEKKAEAAPPAEVGVFTSTSDCADAGKLTADECGHAIDQAVAAHSQNTVIHKSLRMCEAAEGPERCDKTGEGEYRARVQAFFVTMSKPATAVPLYPSSGGTAAFRSPSKQELNVHDESLNMSHSAMSVASENARLPLGGGDASAGGLAGAASSVH